MDAIKSDRKNEGGLVYEYYNNINRNNYFFVYGIHRNSISLEVRTIATRTKYNINRFFVLVQPKNLNTYIMFSNVHPKTRQGKNRTAFWLFCFSLFEEAKNET